jgi:hypothetical protein
MVQLTPEQFAQLQAAAAPAMFQQPPAAGTILGPQNGGGITGLGLTFPEWRLQLPTLHMPCLFKSRRAPEMHIDGGRAPMIAGNPAFYGQLAGASPAAAAAAPPAPANAAPAKEPPTANAAPAKEPDCSAPPPAPAASECPDDSVNLNSDRVLREIQQALNLVSEEEAKLQRMKSALSGKLAALQRSQAEQAEIAAKSREYQVVVARSEKAENSRPSTHIERTSGKAKKSQGSKSARPLDDLSRGARAVELASTHDDDDEVETRIVQAESKKAPGRNSKVRDQVRGLQK